MKNSQLYPALRNARSTTSAASTAAGRLLWRLSLLCLVLTVVLSGARVSAQDEDTCKTIKLGDPAGPGNYPYTVCVPADKCVPKYAEHAYCQKFQNTCSGGHCPNFESACYALDDDNNKGVTSTATAGAACKLFIGTGGQHKKIDGVMCTFATIVAAGGRLGCHCECGQGYAVPIAMSFRPLPEGAVYATATVDPDTTIEVQQPGYAVVVTADVVSTKRVKPGDRLGAKTTASVAFDDGTGMILDTVKQASTPLVATVGQTNLLSRDHPQPLPLQNGNATLCVSSEKPFATPALAIDNVNKLPDTTHAVFLNPNGGKVGALATFKGIQGTKSGNIAVRTLDDKGSTLQERKLEGGVLDASPKASFDKPTYKAGERGQLLIQNQENYQKGMQVTRFGGAGNLSREPIRLIPLSDVKGLPSETPFGTTNLKFQTTHAGEARVAVIFPGMLPPKPVENPGTDEGMIQANSIFQKWLKQVGE